MKVAMVNQTHPHRTQPPLLDTAAHLLKKHPFILWGTSLVLVLLVGGMALKGLIYPGSLESEAVEPEFATAPTKSQPPEISEQDLNLWLFGAVALGCAGGSVLISRRIEQMQSQPKSHPQPSKPKPKQQAVRSQPHPTQKHQPSKATRRSSNPTRRKKAATFPGQRSQAATATVVPNEAVPLWQAGYPNASAVIEPVVTVVPENESHPLDWGEGSLADMMDIRKQKPLSSLL